MNPHDEYKIFLKIADLNGITKAAKALNCSKSMVSKSLSDLEHRLKTVLFQRTTRSLHLTEAGQAFYEKAQQIVELIDEAESSLTQAESALSGKIRIATPSGIFAEKLVYPHLQSFMLEYPEIEFEINMSIKRINLHEKEYDLAIRTGKLDDSSLVAKKLKPLRYAIYASQTYLDEHGTPEVPQDIRHHHCLQIDKSHVWRFRKDGRAVNITPKANLVCNSSYSLIQATQANMGLCRLVSELIDPKMNLVTVLEEFEEAEMPLWVITRQRDLIPKRVQLLIDHLKASFKKC